MARGQFRVLPGGSAVPAQPSLVVDPMVFHASCLDHDGQRGWGAGSVPGRVGTAGLGGHREDVDRVVGGLGGAGAGRMEPAGLCAGVQGLPRVPGRAKGGGDQGGVRCAAGRSG